MAYLALYREWRPKNFRELVGQEHISKTLMNALKQEKVAHAYLFSGPRGTGKTTTAKILAKALNCENPDGVEPCNQCSSCLSIDQGNAMEVLEIDAASNRGIDEIRDLREKVRLSAGESKYKVYIIDEVHMLTTEAFNALLKTLEEPPDRVVFILATTEVHKIPLTILSRVQRFEFHRIPLEQIQERLQEVCDALARRVDSNALIVIAQKSEGGLRDALSILDQCLLLDGNLGVEQVYQVLGMVGEDFSAQLVDQLLSEDYAQTLQVLSEGINQGRDPRQILRELLEYLRQALIYSATRQIPHIPPHLKEKLSVQCEQVGLNRLLRWIGILLQGESQLKYASNARLAAELLLVQVIYDSQGAASPGSGEMLQRLDDMEQEIKKLSLGQPVLKAQDAPSKRAKIQNSQESLPKVVKNPSKDQESIGVIAGYSKQSMNQELTFDQIIARWADVLEQVRHLKKSTHAFLMEGKPYDLKGNHLVIVFKEGFSFHRDKVNQLENRETIEKVLQGIFGTPLVLQNIMESEWGNAKSSEEPDENNVVKKAADLFGADFVVIRE